MQKKHILVAQICFTALCLLVTGVTTAAGPFTTSGSNGLQALLYIMVIGGILCVLLFGLLVYFSFFSKASKFKKASRIILASFFIMILLILSSIYVTPYYPDLQNNIPAGKNYEEVTIFNNRVITRANGDVIIVPHNHFYPDGTRFLFSDNFNTNESGEKIYQVDIAYTKSLYDIKLDQPNKFRQIHGTSQIKFSIPIFPVAVDKYKFVNNKQAYLIVPNEPNTKQILAEDQNAKRALKSIMDSLNRPSESSFKEFLTAIDLISTLDPNHQIPVEVLIENLGWKKRTDELINKGVDVNGLWESPDSSDWSFSPLLWAVSHDHIFDEVVYLMKFGADPHKKNSRGMSPYEKLKIRLNSINDIDESYKSKAKELIQLMED